jgi:hypothetical protein
MNPPAPDDHEAHPPLEMKKRNLTSEERRAIVSRLILSIKPDDPDLKLGRGVITATANSYHVSRITIRKVWQRALANYRNPNIRSFMSSPQKKGNCGRKQKWNREEVREAVKALPLFQKRTIRSLAQALGIPKSTLFDLKEDKTDTVIMPASIALKPLLTEEHKLQRVLYCCSKLNPVDNMYHHFYDSIHVDEKWFFISEKQLRVYIATDEEAPSRYAQNHDHIIKVMFLCAVARPRFNADGVCTFDGKLGMWPFVEYIPAQRRSVNRNRGDIVTTVVSCTRDRYRTMLIEKLIPAIRLKWPDRGPLRTITIQQDGATAHIPSTDQEFNEHARQGVWNIRLETQAAKSPDTNVLDLSFFRALQALQWRSGCEVHIDGLIQQTLQAFAQFDPRKLDFAFLTLQCCMDDILAINGGNDYRIRHIGKSRMLNEGTLPTRIEASEDALDTFRIVMGDPAVANAGGDDDAQGDNDAADNNNNLQMIQHEVDTV